MTTTAVFATAAIEDVEKYPIDVADDLATIDVRLDELRNEWVEAHESNDLAACEEIERRAYGLEQARVSKQFRLNRADDELIAERDYIARVDSGFEDRQLLDESTSNLPTNDSDWLSWKVNKFIKGISHRTASGSLYIGRVRIGGRVPQVENGYFEFRCYARDCKFHGKHYVGGSTGQVQVIIAMILAHYYRHA